MNYNAHLDLWGKHAFLSGSNHHWINYTNEKLDAVYQNKKKMLEGTELHDIASSLVKRRLKMASLKKAFNMFVNDAIGFGMESELVIYYSDNAFGTADAILFKDNILRIHDLKTGSSKVSFNQLYIYAAFFCLEYGIDPSSIDMEFRIYQGNGYMIEMGDATLVNRIMNLTVQFDARIDMINQQM